jgi:cell division protein FtsB
MASAPVTRSIRGWGGPARLAVAALALVAILFLFVFPTRSFLAQRRAVGEEHHRVEVMQEQNERLAEEANRLQTPGEIERLAREQFHMVYPGERAFSVLPEAAPPTTVP